MGGQGGCERRIEVFVTIKKNGGSAGRVGGGGVRVDVNEELKFLGKFKKKRFWGEGVRGSGVELGVWVTVNEDLKFL